MGGGVFMAKKRGNASRHHPITAGVRESLAAGRDDHGGRFLIQHDGLGLADGGGILGGDGTAFSATTSATSTMRASLAFCAGVLHEASTKGRIRRAKIVFIGRFKG